MHSKIQKVSMGIALMGSGAVFGWLGAYGIWNFLYAIGERVISDELYAWWEQPICMAGMAFGAATAALRSALHQRGQFVAFFLQHFMGAVGGFLGSCVGWRHGLIGYFGTQTLVWLACLTYTFCERSRFRKMDAYAA